MIKDFILPDIGEGVVECELIEWLVNEGDNVSEDQPVADVMTDKALVQIPAPYAGIINKLYYQKGELAKVHQPLYSISLTDDELETDNNQIENNTETASSTDDTSCQKLTTRKKLKALASPAVRRLAMEQDIDIGSVSGTGKNGRVYKEDITAYLGQVSDHITNHNQPDKIEPISGIKAKMAQQMVASVSTIPHFTYCDEIDVTDLLIFKKQIQAHYATENIKISLMPFVIKALSLALKAYPILNSQINDNCTEITFKSGHNIGLAIDTKLGLIVPNIKDVQIKSIIDIASESTRLIDEARNGRISSSDLKYGTFTISNIGTIGGTVATPIINKPEVAILAMGKIQALPRFNKNNQVEAKHIMQVSWSADHRIIDGATMANFSNLWKRYIEFPHEMLMLMR